MTDDSATAPPTPDPAEIPAPDSEQSPPADAHAEPDATVPPVDDFTAAATPSAAQAWSEVILRMGDLAEAVAAWATAATDNPENRRRLDDVRRGVNEMAKQADAAFDHVTSSEFGQQMKNGAEDAGQALGDAAHRMSGAAAPHVATAFAGLAGLFERAAQKIGEAAEAAERQSAADAEATRARTAQQPAAHAQPAPDEAPPATEEPGAESPADETPTSSTAEPTLDE